METIEQLPDTARGLWNVLKRTRAWLPENTGEQYWMLGGGTLLAARWRGQDPPRQSEDLDIKIRAPTRERAEEARKRLQIAALERAFENAGGARCRPEQDREKRSSWSQTWRFEEHGEGKIDLVELHLSTPWEPTRGRIEDIELQLEPTASILFGKLWRSHLALARDAFDLAVAGELDPKALTEALQVLGRARTEQVVENIRNAQLRLEMEGQTELKGVVEMWEDLATDPGQTALQAVDRCWKVSESEQLEAIANETERIARRIRRIQLEQGTGEITVSVKEKGLEVTWSEPGEANKLIVVENVSEDDWKRSWRALSGGTAQNQLPNRGQEGEGRHEGEAEKNVGGVAVPGVKTTHERAKVRHANAVYENTPDGQKMLRETVERRERAQQRGTSRT